MKKILALAAMVVALFAAAPAASAASWNEGDAYWGSQAPDGWTWNGT